MSPSTFPARRSGGFTLIELLVVITIIGILAGLVISVAGTIQNRSRKIQAINDTRSAKIAVISYYNDNRRYPISQAQQDAATTGSTDLVFGVPGGDNPNVDLFDILRAVPDDNNQDNVLNPSKTSYFEFPYVKNATTPRNGICTQDVRSNGVTIKKGSLVDPWGNAYIVWIDASKDGELSTIIKTYYKDLGDSIVKTGEPPQGVEFTSLGADGKWGTKGDYKYKGSDDVNTWEPQDKPKTTN